MCVQRDIYLLIFLSPRLIFSVIYNLSMPVVGIIYTFQVIFEGYAYFSPLASPLGRHSIPTFDGSHIDLYLLYKKSKKDREFR